MADVFQSFPDQYAIPVTVTWGDRQMELRFVWKDRLGGWFIDLIEADGTVVVFSRRISVGSGPVKGFGFEGDELPRDRSLVIPGPRDPYARLDLGTDVTTQVAPMIATEEEVAEARLLEKPPTFTTEVFLL